MKVTIIRKVALRRVVVSQIENGVNVQKTTLASVSKARALAEWYAHVEAVKANVGQEVMRA